MDEFLVIRVSSQKETVQWLTCSEDKLTEISSGEISNISNFGEIELDVEKYTAILLLSAADVLLKDINVPVGAGRHFNSMVPYLIEEESAQDVESMHFVVLNKSNDKAKICAVEDKYLEDLLVKFNSVGIKIKKVLPDILAMPKIKNGISVVQLDERWLFCRGSFDSVSIEHNWLDLFLTSDWFSTDVQAQVYSYSPIPEQAKNSGWKFKSMNSVMELFAQEAIKAPINLLVGKFKQASSNFYIKNLLVQKKTIILIGIIWILLTTSNILMRNRYEAQIIEYQTESERIFHAVMPDENRGLRIAQIRQKLSDEEQVLLSRKLKNEVLFLDWLDNLYEGLGSDSGIKIESIIFDSEKGEIRIEGLGQDFDSFEMARVNLSSFFTVEQGQLIRREDLVFGSFSLSGKKAE